MVTCEASSSKHGLGVQDSTMAFKPIAIVGIGCRFPGNADSPSKFWQLILDGIDATRPVPETRWNNERLFSPTSEDEPGSVGSLRGGFVDEVADFDAEFFGISPREAAAMDPQQRLLLEVSLNALEDGGLPLEELRGKDVGVFIGISTTDYTEIQHCTYNQEYINAHTNSGVALSIAANRISYQFDFRGPSLSVDTACSSSLTAVHLACRSIGSGESKIALVGGVNAILKPEATIGFSSASMLASDGHCKAFDASADGFARGEGAGVVILKPLHEALEDRDRIYAVVKGTSINQDGYTTSLTIPNATAQADMLKKTYQVANVRPEEIRYVEAHGTGTKVGDPIEVEALSQIFPASEKRSAPLYIGSVKTNIGHLEAGAGIAGLIKSAMSIYHGVIAPTVHFKTANPNTKLDDRRFCVPTQCINWPKEDWPRRAGVNSFGFGGANAHVVIEESPYRPSNVDTEERRQSTEEEDVCLLTISARDDKALQELASRHALALEQAADSVLISEYCRAAGRRRSHHRVRLALVEDHREQLIEKLRAIAQGMTPDGSIVGDGGQVERSEDRPVFVFSGMGPQWWAMGQELYAEEPVFHDSIERISSSLSKFADWSLVDEMLRPEHSSRMAETQIAQPANFALQVGLANLLQSWGIVPSAIVGHSAGEVAAAYVSGMLDLDEASRVIYQRSRLQHTTTGKGKMIAVGLNAEKAQDVINRFNGGISLAAVNTYSSVTLSGDGDCIDILERELSNDGIFARILQVDVPFHSHHMESIRRDLTISLDGVKAQKPIIPLYSTVTGLVIDDIIYDATYWWRNVRDPVMFSSAIDELRRAGHQTFIELSPHPVLNGSIIDTFRRRNEQCAVIASLRRGDPERQGMLKALGQLFVNGHDLDWQALYPGANKHISLPIYPWQRKSYWHESHDSLARRQLVSPHDLLGIRVNQPELSWINTIDLQRQEYLKDHGVQGLIVFPAAGYIEVLLAAGREIHSSLQLDVHGIAFEQPLILKNNQRQHLQVNHTSDTNGVTIHSKVIGEDTVWQRHVYGNVCKRTIESRKIINIEAVRERCRKMAAGRLYEIFAASGLNYGPAFQGINSLWSGHAEALAQLHTLPQLFPKSKPNASNDYLLHPTILDASLQTLIGTLTDDEGAKIPTFLPVSLETLRFHASPKAQQECFVYVRRTKYSNSCLEGDIYLLNQDGQSLAEIRGICCHHVKSKAESNDWLYSYEWRGLNEPQGIDSTWASDVTPAGLTANIREQVNDLSIAFGRDRYYRDIEPFMTELSIAFAWEALKRLGANWQIGEHITVDRICSDLNIKRSHRRLTNRILRLLADKGLLKQVDAQTWSVDALYSGPKSAKIHKAFLDQLDDEPPPELTLLDHCGGQLASVLAGETDPIQVIFPNGEQTYTDPIYKQSSNFAVYNEIVERIVRLILAKMPEDRRLRILEIGAGSGALASLILERLPANRLSYTYTDISSHFLVRARERFLHIETINYEVLDIEKEPVSQGFEPASFDVVLAGDVLHATRDLKSAVEHATSMLVPDGLLLLLEITNPPVSGDLTFGLLKGWWAFEDTHLRADHCCIDQISWVRLLKECGQTDINLLTDRTMDDARSVHSVILSKRPTEAVQQSDIANDEAGVWLFVMDEGETGNHLKAHFESNKCNILPISFVDDLETKTARSKSRFISSGDISTLRDTVDDITGETTFLAGVVFLQSLDAPSLHLTTSDALEKFTKTQCLNIINLCKVIDELSHKARIRFIISSQDLQHVLEHDSNHGALNSSIWGLGRSIVSEYSNFDVTMIDLPAELKEGDIGIFYNEVVKNNSFRTEVAIRGGEIFQSRLLKYEPEVLRDCQQIRRDVDADSFFYLDLLQSGSIDSLTLKQKPLCAPTAGEVQIEVHHASLNFRDLMKVLDVYPDEDGGTFYIGDECSGIIRDIGEDVTDFAVGDRVAAIAQGFSSVVTVSTDFVMKVPAHVSLQQAASIPIAFLTAWYALVDLGRLQAEERVLIHAAAGGVGLAAVQIAKNVGADVFATASSDEKHAHLASMSVQNIMSSRRLDFHDEVMEQTNGEGIDVVLNSLSGEFIAASIRLLRPYGRFLEIGKSDIYEKRDLNLYPFRNDLSYAAIDLSRMFRQRPARIKQLLNEITWAFQEKKLTPLPVTSFDIDDASQAFRHMAQAKHIGKIVLDLGQGRKSAVRASCHDFAFRKNASYLITGGLGGVGLAVAHWMAQMGAGHIILAGRRTILNKDRRTQIETLEKSGSKVSIITLDVADPDALSRALAEVSDDLFPLKGVIHMAMVLDDRFIKDQDERSLSKVFGPKVTGAWNLHQATKDQDLDFFAMFSSVAAVWGNPGQSNYVAASEFLDALARYRRAQDLPALTIAWGPIADVGYVAQREEIKQHFDRMGVASFDPEEAVNILHKCLQNHVVSACAVRINWDEYAKHAPDVMRSSCLSHLIGGRQKTNLESEQIDRVLADLENADHTDRPELLQRWLARRLATILAYEKRGFDISRPLVEFGMDSLMSVELARLIKQDLGLEIRSLELHQSASIEGLTRRLLNDLEMDVGSPDS